MSKVDLSLFIQAGGDESEQTIRGIPAPLWRDFQEAAAELMPEKPANEAWAVVIAELIAAVVDKGNTHTLLMTDIPAKAADALQNVTMGANITRDYLIASLYQMAAKNELSILRFDNGNAGHAVVILDISEDAWQFWKLTAMQNNMTPETLLGAMFNAAHNSELVVNNGSVPNGTNTANRSSTNQSKQQSRVEYAERLGKATAEHNRRRTRSALNARTRGSGDQPTD